MHGIVKKLTLSAGWLVMSMAAQTRVDLKTQSANVDFQTAPYTKPLKSGVALPAACAQGEMFFVTSAAPGTNLFGCTATNTWTAQGIGGGPSALTIESNGTLVGTRSIANLVPGSGIFTMIFDTGTKFNVQQSVDSAVVLTRAGLQSGRTLLCASAGASDTAYTCTMIPRLTAYATGMLVNWIPDVSAAGGGTTLDIDILGPKDVKLADGTSDPTADDIVGGRMYLIWYDGAMGKFRRVQ